MQTNNYIQVTNTVSLPSPPGGNIPPNFQLITSDGLLLLLFIYLTIRELIRAK